MPTTLAVVAAALRDESGRILMQRRRAGAEHGGLWEFPGGKIEPLESPESAILREISEELGVALDPGRLASCGWARAPAAATSAYDEIVILLYTCDSWQGTVTALDADELGWFAPETLADLAMPPADRILAEQLGAAV